MKLESDIWIVIVIFGVLYLLIKYIQEYSEHVKIKIRTRKIIESVIEARIIKKEMVEGMSISSSTLGGCQGTNGKYPNSYIIICEDEDRNYTINDRHIFNSYEVDDIVKLRLMERMDNNDCVISYRILDVFK